MLHLLLELSIELVERRASFGLKVATSITEKRLVHTITIVNAQQFNIGSDSSPLSVSDIQDKYFEGKKLSAEEKSALQNFNNFRITYLKGANNEGEFEERYFELQIRANLLPFTEFLEAS